MKSLEKELIIADLWLSLSVEQRSGVLTVVETWLKEHEKRYDIEHWIDAGGTCAELLKEIRLKGGNL